MANKMSLLDFLKEDQGEISVEYVVFVGAIAILLTAGVAALMNAMGGYFNSWAAFFNASG
jgi:Flp pilus assembly pilin Flp